MWTQKVLALLLFVGVVTLVSCYVDYIEERVVGGTDSNINRFPFMARLHGCGCTILGRRWMLTAAHCVSGVHPSNITIQYGVTDVDNDDGPIAYVSHVFVHEDYDKHHLWANDIALLRLSEELPIQSIPIAFVNLPEKNFEVPQVPERAQGILIGWGDNEKNESQPILQEDTVWIHSNSECNIPITDNKICAGGSMCSGDSGGPLLYQGPNGLIQVGIVSYSADPCDSSHGAYTKVSHYVDWINNIVAYWS